MITEEQARELIDIALKHGKEQKLDGIEVNIEASNIATSRFANNGMTQNQSPEHISISVRVQNKGKQIRLSSDLLSPNDIIKLVDNAISACAFLAPDKDMLPLVKPEDKSAQKDVDRYDKPTAAFSAEQRAKAIQSIVAVAKENNLSCAGIFASGSTVQAIGNSNGLFRFYTDTNATVSITMKRVDPANGSESTGWAKQNSPRVGDIDAAGLAKRAAQKAIASANPQDIEPGRYTVVLEPSAVLDLVCYLWNDFTGTSHTDKLSAFLGKVGQQVVGKNVTLSDDVFHPLQSGPPFDGEGLQRQAVDLIQAGVLKGLVLGRKSAAELKMAPTGHGLPEPSSMGEWPNNFVMQGGDTTLEDMIRSTKRGLLLTRVWYVREVDPTQKIETGMTRDGTFLIEDGVVKAGVKNLRFNESLIEMLSNVSALGPSIRAAGEEATTFPDDSKAAVVPALKVEEFHFSSVTRF